MPPDFRQLTNRRKNILRADFKIWFKTGRSGIAADEFGMLVGFFDAQRRRCATAQAIQAQRAGTGEQFQHPRADHPRAERVEDRLLDEVGRGTHVKSLGDLEDTPRCFAAGDAHGYC